MKKFFIKGINFHFSIAHLKGNKMNQKAQNKPKIEIKCPKGTRDYDSHQMAIRRTVMDTIVSIFKKHGGAELDTPVFERKEILTGKYGEESSKLIYQLQDQGGQKLALRYDLTVPLCRYMGMNTNISKIKRFHIGKVYRRDQPIMTKGRYRQFYQCDFDIAGVYDRMIPDAQILAIMQEVLEALGIQNYEVKINHRKILEGIVLQAGCDLEKFNAICNSIDKLDKLSWAEVKTDLITNKGVTEQQADIIGYLTKHKQSPSELLEILKSKKLFVNTFERLSPVIDDMDKLFSYLKAMNRHTKAVFDLSLTRGLDYYTGLIFEIVLKDNGKELGSISGGGRYDNLIGMFSNNQIPAVGGSIGIQRLFNILQEMYANKVKPNASEVLVSTIGKVPVESKLSVLSELWKLGINAQTMYVEKAKPDKQIKFAFENSIPLILWIGEDELKSGELKLKILYKNQQVNVALNDLSGTLLPYIESFRTDYQNGKVNFKETEKE